jgi:RNA exonuclease 1
VAALDCEMCDTAWGPRLTRLTLLDQDGAVVLDTLVKPEEAITDYKTAFSGLTARDLEEVTVSLQQVRLALLRLVHRETVLVGHSLENDLISLRLVHDSLCVDSALLFPHPSGFPRRLKLKQLAEDFLQLRIQRDGKGHDSVEDAR